MPRKYPEIQLKQKLKLINKAKINQKTNKKNFEEIENIDLRIKKIISASNKIKKNKKFMLYFVMYDIENDKVRREIAKYLLKKGCVRVQKSIFFASTERKIFNEIHKTLLEVQQSYENNDSIFLVPISTDEIMNTKIIGKNIDFQIIMGNTNTLFF